MFEERCDYCNELKGTRLECPVGDGRHQWRKVNEVNETSSKSVPLYPENWLIPRSTWVHVKTSGSYRIVGISTCSTNNDWEGQRCVVYVNKDDQLFHREISEFLDGRFNPAG